MILPRIKLLLTASVVMSPSIALGYSLFPSSSSEQHQALADAQLAQTYVQSTADGLMSSEHHPEMRRVDSSPFDGFEMNQRGELTTLSSASGASDAMLWDTPEYAQSAKTADRNFKDWGPNVGASMRGGFTKRLVSSSVTGAALLLQSNLAQPRRKAGSAQQAPESVNIIPAPPLTPVDPLRDCGDGVALPQSLPCTKGEELVVPAMLFFDFAKSDLSADAARILDDVAAAYHRAKPGKLLLVGYADRAGAPEANLVLAQQRADAAKAYLIPRGVPEAAIATSAAGEGRPIVLTEDGVREPQNRRVEVRFDAP